MDYYQKYLKYKNKYLQLKNKLYGSGYGRCTNEDYSTYIPTFCTCTKFNVNVGVDVNDETKCLSCNHAFNEHEKEYNWNENYYY